MQPGGGKDKYQWQSLARGCRTGTAGLLLQGKGEEGAKRALNKGERWSGLCFRRWEELLCNNFLKVFYKLTILSGMERKINK